MQITALDDQFNVGLQLHAKLSAKLLRVYTNWLKRNDADL